MQKTPPHYSPYYIAGNTLYTSGQLPLIDRINKVSAEGIEAQTRLVLDKVQDILLANNLTKNNIIKTTAYITDLAYWDVVNAVYADFFGAHKPSRSIIPVSTLHFGCLIELEAIAYINR